MSEQAGSAPGPPAGSERQRAIDILCEAFANDDIELAEFERRVESVHAAESADELKSLLAGLPAAPPARGERSPAEARQREPSTAPAPRRTASVESVADQNVVVGFLGGGKRKGPWTPARTNWAVAVMGGIELDFRQAVLPPGVTEVKAFAFWGGVDIVVPPDVRVECSGIGIMGGFDHSQTAHCTDDPDAPVLVIGGWALMGGITVTVRYAGESVREARRRHRSEIENVGRRRRGELGDGSGGRGRPGPGS